MTKQCITVVICDDEVQILKKMESFVRQIFEKSGYCVEVLPVSNPVKLVKMLDEVSMDILLLDIDMPYVNGMEIAKLITEKELPILFLFVTSKEALVYDSFQYHPFSFIRKSTYEKDLEETLLRAVKHIMSQAFLTIQKGNELHKLLLSDILYMEADGNYVQIVTNKESIRQRATLGNMEKQLKDKGFVRIHKGFLVNQEAVYRLTMDTVVLKNEEELPIGRNAREETREQLMRSFRI